MGTITKDELWIKKDDFIGEVLKGSLFIYPTDTIYGIGCSAKLSEPIKKIREIKGRYDSPFSIIAPSKDWIRKNCIVTEEAEEWIEKLPGPYTLILKLKNKECIAKEVNGGMDSIGIRIPSHWISHFIEEIGVPVVTTSVNKTGEIFMTSVENMDPEIKPKVEFIVDEGERKGRPSTIVHLDGDTIEIKER